MNKATRTRRQFLQESMAAAATVGVMTNVSDAKSENPTTRPSWGIACRDAHLPATGEKDAFKAMAAIGAEGVEVTVNMDGKCPGLFGVTEPYSIATPAEVKRLADAMAVHKKRISAFCLHNQFDKRPDEELALIRMTTEASAEMRVPAVRLDVVPRTIKKEDEFLKFAVKIGQRIVKETDGAPVRFGVENHGGTTNKPEFLLAMFEGVGSKRFGSTLDTANFYWFGYPLSKLYEIYEVVAPWACHTHCKSINYPESEREKQRKVGWEYGKYCCPVYEGEIDFKRVVKILRDANYAGDLCIEDESLGRFKGKAREILTKEVGFLRRMIETA